MEFTYGDRIKILLDLVTKENGKSYSIMEVCEGVGISKSAMYSLYNGQTTRPSYDMLKKFANFFGVDAGYFSCQTRSECIEFIAQSKQKDEIYKAQIRARVTEHNQHVREAIEELMMLIHVNSALGEPEHSIDMSILNAPPSPE